MIVAKNTDSGVTDGLVLKSWLPSLTRCATLGKLFNIPAPLFPHPHYVVNPGVYFLGLLTWIKCYMN